MALLDPQIEAAAGGVGTGAAALGLIEHFLSFVKSLAQFESVESVGIGPPRLPWDVWVIQRHDNHADAQAIYGLEYEYQAQPGVFPPDVHVISRAHVDPEALPTFYLKVDG